jgi:hypothetical protein
MHFGAANRCDLSPPAGEVRGRGQMQLPCPLSDTKLIRKFTDVCHGEVLCILEEREVWHDKEQA